MNGPVRRHGERIRIRGVVQGVGFRPTVWRIARELNLTGSVRNDGRGVLIEVWVDDVHIDRFLARLKEQLPPLAKIDSIERCITSDAPERVGFEIVASGEGAVETAIVADAATCPACLAEVGDPADRRYRYAFTNCTHCGPRFSIVKAIPYDRANTSMSSFTMCLACRAEYDNPADRRFHAQPNACPDCGPRIWLQDAQGMRIDCDDAIGQSAALISSGKIVAIKGIGGFHLACDAANEEAVTRLRQCKRRYHKPFALLARDLRMIGRFAHVDETGVDLLQSAAAPIVLLQARGETLAKSIAPGHRRLGFALPSTPLHHLLMQVLEHPIVLTSGNISDEPQCIDNDEACEKLGSIADAFLLHDREIVNRVDDSVFGVVDGRAMIVRRARGYAPAALMFPAGFENAPAVLAMGAELKSTFCLTNTEQAVVSQHIGDLENAPVLEDYRRQLQLYESLYRHRPEIIAVDKHPNYLSTQYGRELAKERDVECVEVQHHHAHVAAVMVEHGLPLDCKPVLGIALDGLGMGDDGELWGGEFFAADYLACKRLASFDPVALLGGNQATREPWRNTLAQLLHYFDLKTLVGETSDLELMRYLQTKQIPVLAKMAEKRLNSPLCSSAGRLFDAVAAALNICRDEAHYEGQAAIELEALAATSIDQAGAAYPVHFDDREDGRRVITWGPMWQALLNDLQQGVAASEIAARFHAGLTNAIIETAMRICRAQSLGTVVLSGGVFQNALLLEGVRRGLKNCGVGVLAAGMHPAGDGAISLGQAAVAIARSIRNNPDLNIARPAYG